MPHNGLHWCILYVRMKVALTGPGCCNRQWAMRNATLREREGGGGGGLLFIHVLVANFSCHS